MGKKVAITPKERWRAAFERYATALIFVLAAIGVIAGGLTRFTLAQLVGACLTFLSWPRPVQGLVTFVAFVIVGIVAGVIQTIQYFKALWDEGIVTRGVEAAIHNTLGAAYDEIIHLLRQIAGRLLEPPVGRPSAPPARPGGRELPGHEPLPIVEQTENECFVGRDEEVKWLVTRLRAHSYDQDVTVVHGISGIGKSALIHKAIERIRPERFTDADAVTHLTCGDISEHITIIRATLERVGADKRLPPAVNIELLRQASKQLLTDKERLIVLDGVQPDVQLSEIMQVLRTDEHKAHILIATTVAVPIELVPKERQLDLQPLGVGQTDDGQPVDWALEMFAQYAGLNRASEFGPDLSHAQSIVEKLDRHTYALQLVGASLRRQPNMLKQTADQVSSLANGEAPEELDDILKPAYVALEATLKSLDYDALRLLVGFVAAFGKTDAGRNATFALMDALHIGRRAAAVSTLLLRELMASATNPDMPRDSDANRLRIHTLLRTFVKKRFIKDEDNWRDDVTSARDAAANYYARYLEAYDHSDPTRATQRAIKPDADNVTKSLIWAIDTNQHSVIAAIAHGMRRYWHDRWLNDQSERFLPTATASATLMAEKAKRERQVDEARRQRQFAADLSFNLGRVYRRIGQLEQAEELFRLDLRYRQSIKDYAAQAHVLHQFAQLERSRGNMKQGMLYCRQGLRIIRRRLPPEDQRTTKAKKDLADNFLQAKGLLLAQQGRIERSRGNLASADNLFEQAFEIFQQTDDLLEQGVALGYRGRIARVRGDFKAAEDFFQQSDQLARRVNDVRGQGVIATQRGRIARIQGDVKGAEEEFTKGLELAEQVLDHTAEAVNHNYLGRIASGRGDTVEADRHFRIALEIAERIGDRAQVGVNYHYRGRLVQQRGHLQEARRLFDTSYRILRSVEDKRGRALVLAQIALLDMGQKRYLRATWRLWRSLTLIRSVQDRRSEGNILLYCGQLDFELSNYQAALVRFQQALERAQELRDVGGVRDAAEWLEKAQRMSTHTPRGAAPLPS